MNSAVLLFDFILNRLGDFITHCRYSEDTQLEPDIVLKICINVFGICLRPKSVCELPLKVNTYNMIYKEFVLKTKLSICQNY